MDRALVSDGTLEELPRPSTVGTTRVGGVDIGKPRMRTVMNAVLALAPAPAGFSTGELAAKVRQIGGTSLAAYDARRAAYDLKKLRGKQLVGRIERSHRYHLLHEGLRTLAALVLLREKVLKLLLAAASLLSGSAPSTAISASDATCTVSSENSTSSRRIDKLLSMALWQVPSTGTK